MRNYSRFHPHLSMGIAMLDQLLLSASGLLLAILVARSIPIAEFGALSLAMTAVYFAASVQNSLIIAPHAVLASPLPTGEFENATTTSLFAQIALCLGTSIVFLVATVISLTMSDTFYRLLMWGLLASVASQFQDYFRRVLYSKSRILPAFANDVLSCGLQALVLLMMFSLNTLTGASAMQAIAIGSGTAAVLGFCQTHVYYTKHISPGDVQRWCEHGWRIGRWLLGSSLLAWLTTSVYPLLIGGLVGLSTLALLRSAQTVLGLTNIIFRFLDTTLLPIAAVRYSAHGKLALDRFLSRAALLLIPCFGGLIVCSALFSRELMSHLFGSSYADGSWVLVPLAVAALMTAMSSMFGLGLKAMSRTGPQFVAFLAASIVNVTVGAVFVWRFGLEGAVIGVLLNSAIVLAVVYYSFRSNDEAAMPRLPEQSGNVQAEFGGTPP